MEQVPASMLFGVRVHHVTMDRAVAVINRLIRSGGSHHVVTINGAMLALAARDEAVRRLFNGASLAIPDGVGVVLTARILGRPGFERVPGIELAGQLCALSARERYRVYFLGAARGAADAAAEELRRRYPGLHIVGTHHGYFTKNDEPSLVRAIKDTAPHLLLVGLGAPRQEEWIANHLESLGAGVCIGVGGTFDVLSGRLRRAPQWVQRASLEWLYRFVQEPRRWRATAALPLLILFALRERLSLEWKRLRNKG